MYNVKYFLSQARAIETNYHLPKSMSRAELVTDTYRDLSNLDPGLRCRRGRQVRRCYDEDSTKFVQGVSQLPSESKLKTAREKVAD